MKNFDIVMVAWSRVQQSGGEEKNSDSRWILKIESSALTQAFSMNIMTETFFSKFTKLFPYSQHCNL